MKDLVKVVSKTAPIKCILTITSLFIVILGMSKVHAQEHTGYRTGFNSVMLGHSFLKHGAEQINIRAPEYNYLLHNQYRAIGYGGENGAPGAIWNNPPTCEPHELNSNGLCPGDPKNQIIDEDVELLVLTAFFKEDPNEPGEIIIKDSFIGDYVKWVEFALLNNPNTLDTVAILVPWSHYADFNAEDEMNSLEDFGKITHRVNHYIDNKIISKLRAVEAFQDLEFLHIAGGNAAYALLHEYEKGYLIDEVDGAICPDYPQPCNITPIGEEEKEYIMHDRRGHADKIFEELLGFVWQKTIYPDTDFENTPPPSIIPEWTYDLRSLAQKVWERTNFSKRLNDQPIGQTPPQFILIDGVISENDATVNQDYADTNSTLANNALDVNFDPLTFAIVDGPEWLKIDGDGNLYGLPDSSDQDLNTFTVSVSDGFATVDATLQINVKAESSNSPPVFQSETIIGPDATAGKYYGINLAQSATDADGDTLTFSFVDGGIFDCSDNSWLSVTDTGQFYGRPDGGEIGTTICSIKVEDGQGGSDTALLRISVIAAE
jgi:hypothetical protein